MKKVIGAAIVLVPLSMVTACFLWPVAKMADLPFNYWRVTRWTWVVWFVTTLISLACKSRQRTRFIQHYADFWELDPQLIDAGVGVGVFDINKNYEQLSKSDVERKLALFAFQHRVREMFKKHRVPMPK